MKNLILLFILFGPTISQMEAQSFQKYQRPKLQCKVNVSIGGPSSVEDGRPARIDLTGQGVHLIKKAEIFLNDKFVGSKTQPYYYWWINTKSRPLPSGRYHIMVKYSTKCGDKKTLSRDFKVLKLR